MPSPFPGMDPYFEGSHWMAVHSTLAGEIQRYLVARVRPRYLVLPTERFIMEDPFNITVAASNAYPDVGIVGTGVSIAMAPSLTLEAPLVVDTIIPTSIPHITIEIRDVAQRQLVTAIEILSPTNKRGEGREEYLAKRRRLLLSTAHLLEIDLLREGHRVPMQQPLPPAPYFVFLGRYERRPRTEIWPIALDGPLPTVPVPLLPGDPDVLLDLQALWASTYDLLGGEQFVDYSLPPEIPLRGTTVAWAEERLRAAGVRE